jgi:alanine dehydrogenase
MKIGVPKEIKDQEYRVGMTPSCVDMYIHNGDSVFIEHDAGKGAGFDDSDYIKQGAIIVDTPSEAWDVDMVVKVKEPLPQEYQYFKKDLILYTYLHLAACPDLAKALLQEKVTSIAYETIKDKDGTLPCLMPMSQIAGRMSIQSAALCSQNPTGNGVLLGGVPGVKKATVTILGGGIVGTEAAKMAIGLGANVNILDISGKRLSYLDDIFGQSIQTLYSNRNNIKECLESSDVVIGAVLIPGAKAPKLVSMGDLVSMKKGSVIVDVSIDQGGCFESSKPTTHDNPVYDVSGVVHYCVANIPGIVAQTSTKALTSQTTGFWLNYIQHLDFQNYNTLSNREYYGFTTVDGYVVNDAVKQSLGL